jgi:hypothetical protein
MTQLMRIGVKLVPVYTVDIDYIDTKPYYPYVKRCVCKNKGKDDGQTTCWTHHECGYDCTHQE